MTLFAMMTLMPAPERRIGVDIGGTKIDVIVFDSVDKIVFEKRIATPQAYELMVKAIAASTTTIAPR